MIEQFVHGAVALFTNPVTLGFFFAGLLGGLLFGAIPGVNMLTLGAIILPFTGKMEARDAIMFYAVMYCSGTYGGAITAILFNIPGSPENAPTAFDGYPMTQQGKAAKAIGAAVMCSAAGGFISALVMIVATPLIANWAITVFGPPEIFALVIFGIAVAASVGARTLWKGWLSVLIGAMIATVGLDPVGGFERYHFGSTYLLAGINFIPVILGFFALSEVFIQAEKRAIGMAKVPKLHLEFPSWLEFWRLRFAVLRSLVIGFFSGVLPGIGATLAAFMSYNEAVRWSKHRERFGKGELEGVVSSETANNAATGGAMIPLLALGIPGGALTAMMIGVFQMHDMQPGPLVFVNSADLVWVVFVAMFFANIAILLLGWLEINTVVHLVRIPFQFLAPAILLLAVVGAYAVRSLAIDVIVMIVAGIVAYLLRRSGYSVAGIVLGLILGDLGEAKFAQTMQMMHYDVVALFSRPIAAVLLIGAALTLVVSVYKEVRGRRRDMQLAG